MLQVQLSIALDVVIYSVWYSGWCVPIPLGQEQSWGRKQMKKERSFEWWGRVRYQKDETREGWISTQHGQEDCPQVHSQNGTRILKVMLEYLLGLHDFATKKFKTFFKKIFVHCIQTCIQRDVYKC